MRPAEGTVRHFMTTFHFQFRGEAGWEVLGAGLGEGQDAIVRALDEVRGFYGGRLPPGRYQVIESRSEDSRWRAFELGGDGEVVAEDGLATGPDRDEGDRPTDRGRLLPTAEDPRSKD